MNLIPYLQAASQLKAQIKATPYEIALWCLYGDPELDAAYRTKKIARFGRNDNGRFGLRAYYKDGQPFRMTRYFWSERNVDSPNAPYSEYLDALHQIYFDEAEIATFEPGDRYFTFESLRAKWGQKVSEPDVLPFIQARIRDAELATHHPFPIHAEIVDLSLFAQTDIERIEAKHFGETKGDARHNPKWQRRAEALAKTMQQENGESPKRKAVAYALHQILKNEGFDGTVDTVERCISITW